MTRKNSECNVKFLNSDAKSEPDEDETPRSNDSMGGKIKVINK
jgi:hypothetical protein